MSAWAWALALDVKRVPSDGVLPGSFFPSPRGAFTSDPSCTIPITVAAFGIADFEVGVSINLQHGDSKVEVWLWDIEVWYRSET